MQARVPLVVHLALPGAAVAVYCVMALPPSAAGAVQLTAIRALPGVPTTFSGLLGTAGTANEWFSVVAPRAPPQPSIAIE